MLRLLLPASIAALLLAGCAGEMPPMFSKNQSSIGPVLTDASGRTLYLFDDDEPGESACVGKCLEYWPPVLADNNASPNGRFDVIKRPDGRPQWAIQGKPLYYWNQDKAPGDTKGDKYGDNWHAVRM